MDISRISANKNYYKEKVMHIFKMMDYYWKEGDVPRLADALEAEYSNGRHDGFKDARDTVMETPKIQTLNSEDEELIAEAEALAHDWIQCKGVVNGREVPISASYYLLSRQILILLKQIRSFKIQLEQEYQRGKTDGYIEAQVTSACLNCEKSIPSRYHLICSRECLAELCNDAIAQKAKFGYDISDVYWK